MDYQSLLLGAYEEPEIQEEERVVIENPYDGDSCAGRSADRTYDLNVLNTSIPAGELVEMVQNAMANDRRNRGGPRGIRMLFYGVSGGGKSRLAHYIADSIGKKVISKNASDIFAMYVGESEKNIARTFSEAEDKGCVLLFDEVDSFFRERSYATQRFEITETNEFLTQMENYGGIVICTTNFREIMDRAMQRRFHIMVEFKALDDEGVEILLDKFFPQFDFSEEQLGRLCRYESATPGDFGNIHSRLRFLAPEKVNAEYIIQELCRCQEEKQCGRKAVGFMR